MTITPRCPQTLKVCHALKGSAERHARNLAAKDGHRMVVYRCGVCGAWHVGHKRAQRRRQGR